MFRFIVLISVESGSGPVNLRYKQIGSKYLDLKKLERLRDLELLKLQGRCIIYIILYIILYYNVLDSSADTYISILLLLFCFTFSISISIYNAGKFAVAWQKRIQGSDHA
jgi:hypothetical protein